MIFDLTTILSLVGASSIVGGTVYIIFKRALHDIRVIVDDLDDIVSSGQIDTAKIAEIKDRFRDIFPAKTKK